MDGREHPQDNRPQTDKNINAPPLKDRLTKKPTPAAEPKPEPAPEVSPKGKPSSAATPKDKQSTTTAPKQPMATAKSKPSVAAAPTKPDPEDDEDSDSYSYESSQDEESPPPVYSVSCGDRKQRIEGNSVCASYRGPVSSILGIPYDRLQSVRTRHQ